MMKKTLRDMLDEVMDGEPCVRDGVDVNPFTAPIFQFLPDLALPWHEGTTVYHQQMGIGYVQNCSFIQATAIFIGYFSAVIVNCKDLRPITVNMNLWHQLIAGCLGMERNDAYVVDLAKWFAPAGFSKVKGQVEEIQKILDTPVGERLQHLDRK